MSANNSALPTTGPGDGNGARGGSDGSAAEELPRSILRPQNAPPANLKVRFAEQHRIRHNIIREDEDGNFKDEDNDKLAPTFGNSKQLKKAQTVKQKKEAAARLAQHQRPHVRDIFSPLLGGDSPQAADPAAEQDSDAQPGLGDRTENRDKKPTSGHQRQPAEYEQGGSAPSPSPNPNPNRPVSPPLPHQQGLAEDALDREALLKRRAVVEAACKQRRALSNNNQKPGLGLILE
jgi:hypothetical protein